MRMLLLSIAVLLLLLPAGVSAQGIPMGAMEFKTASSFEKDKKIIESGIEGAVEDMSFITRPIARSKLKKTNLPLKVLKFKITPKKVTIQHDSRNPAVSDVDGKPTKWKRQDGDEFFLSQVVKPQLIMQTFKDGDGKKVLKYKFSKDYKKLTMEVIVTSPKLAGPLKYTLNYVRK